MDVKILEDKKGRLVFTVEGDATVANALKTELWNDEHVKISGYHIEHPLLNIPTFVLETDGADTRKTVAAAVKRLARKFEKLQDEAKKLK